MHLDAFGPRRPPAFRPAPGPPGTPVGTVALVPATLMTVPTGRRIPMDPVAHQARCAK